MTIIPLMCKHCGATVDITGSDAMPKCCGKRMSPAGPIRSEKETSNAAQVTDSGIRVSSGSDPELVLGSE